MVFPKNIRKYGKSKEGLKWTGIAFALLAFMIMTIMLFRTLSGCHTLTEYVINLEQSECRRRNVAVAVIDSGISGLDEYQDRLLPGYDFLQEDDDPDDTYGHGTEIASLILSNTSDYIKLMPLKAADEYGFAERENVCRALEYAAENGADIINLSLNALMDGTEENDRLNMLVEELSRKGITVIVSAGNTGDDVCNLSPSNVDDAIVVAAVDEEKIPYFFSGHGDSVDFCSQGRYAGELGASFSAAYVTSAAATLKMYGIDNVEDVFERYAEKYASGAKGYGRGYIWLDYFSIRTEDKAAENDTLIAYSVRQENDLGLDILQLDWKEAKRDDLEKYFSNTDKAYVGMFLKSLSEDELTQLYKKCPLLHSDISVAVCHWDAASDAYLADSECMYDFSEYCISQYEDSIREMTTSSLWLIKNTKMIFYISNADRTVTYRCEVSGNIQNKESGVHEHNVLGKDGSLTLTISGIKDNVFAMPQLAGTGIKAYVTSITSRWVVFTGPDVNNGNVAGVIKNGGYNTINCGDNGAVFYGISIPFTGMTLDMKAGYHYNPDGIKTYKYGTDDMAKSYQYAHLTSTGWIYDNHADVVNLNAGFQKLSNRLTAISYTAKMNSMAELDNGETVYDYKYGEETYLKCPDPTVVSRSVAGEYYDIKERQVYRLTNQSSFDPVRGEMTLNTDIFGASSLEFYEKNKNVKVYVNDTAEYVIALLPNYYNVTLDANWGTLTDYRTGEKVNTATVVTCFDSTDYNFIDWAKPEREGFVFAGWYTERDNGEEVWDINGNADSKSIYWQNGVWKYSTHDWSENNNNICFYAHWVPICHVVLDANWGNINDYIVGNGITNTTNFFTEYGQNYYNNISLLNPQREGFTFMGWFTDPEDPGNDSGKDNGRDGGIMLWDANGRAVCNSTFWNEDGNWLCQERKVAAFARWENSISEKKYYSICFNANGGAGKKPGMDGLEYNINYTLPLNNPPDSGFSRTGWRFNGWNTKPNGNGISYQDGDNISKTTDSNGQTIVLYAQWLSNTYTIHYEGNGASSGSMSNQANLRYDTTYILYANDYTKSGYTFDGWNTRADGSGIGYSDRASVRGLSEENKSVVTLYAQWKPTSASTGSGSVGLGTGIIGSDDPDDLEPPIIINETIEELSPGSTNSSIIYGWVNRNIRLIFSSEDSGSGMASLILYDGYGTGGNILRSETDHVEYTVSRDGIFYFTLVASDRAGNTTTLYITTKIDHETPKGDMSVSYDGRHLDISINNIVEENRVYPGNSASGCRKAWVVLEGLDADKHTICQENRQLTLLTPGNIYTGAVFSGNYDLGGQFNYESAYIRIKAYIMDNAGNYLPAVDTTTIPAFLLTAYVERCLGEADYWKAGEAGIIHACAASHIDRMEIVYPEEWIELDDTLADHIFDYAHNREHEKYENDLFYIPLQAEDGEYTITIHAYKDEHEKSVELPIILRGSILDEIRTRLR